MGYSNTNPEKQLSAYARKAILDAKGDTEKARDNLNLSLIEANDAVLERCLCEAYRNTALRAVLAVQFHELRAEGKLGGLRRPTPIRTTDHNKIVTRSKPSDFLWSENGMTAGAIVRRYLDSFMVNGKPIGDCTVAEVDAAADAKDRDLAFMRRLVDGLPPNMIVREARTEEDAALIWNTINARPVLSAAESV